MNNNNHLWRFFTFPIIALIIHLVLSVTRAYKTITWIDIPMHLIGGITIGMLYTKILFRFRKKEHLGRINKKLFFLFTISLVALTILTWEFLEFGIDNLLNIHTQSGLTDTMVDMFLSFIGGISGYYLVKKNNHNQ